MNTLDLQNLGLEEMNEMEAKEIEGGGLLVLAFAIGFYVGYQEVMSR